MSQYHFVLQSLHKHVAVLLFTTRLAQSTSPTQPQYKSMRPLQCVLRHHIANPNLHAHMATQHGNIHPAIPLRKEPRTIQQPEIQQAQGTTRARRTSLQILENTKEKPFASGSTAAAPAYLSSPAAANLHGKTQGLVPRLPPKTKPMQHPHSRYNSFCSIRLQSRISLCTWQHNVAALMQGFPTVLSATRDSTLSCDASTSCERHMTTGCNDF